MASTAPAYSLAATLGLIIASGGALLSGVKAPAGLILMVIWRVMAPGFFKGITLPRRSDDLLLEPAFAAAPHFGLPDSGDMPTVDPQTGEELTKS